MWVLHYLSGNQGEKQRISLLPGMHLGPWVWGRGWGRATGRLVAQSQVWGCPGAFLSNGSASLEAPLTFVSVTFLVDVGRGHQSVQGVGRTI